MMEIREIDKESFSVLGKEGGGKSENAMEWITPLWKDANENFSEIFPLCLRDSSGKIAGFWGAMSDLDRTFRPWRDGEGRYLAGAEVVPDAQAIPGWSLWKIPGFRYVVIRCTMRTYSEAMAKVMKEYMPRHGYLLVGAIQEFYDPANAPGELELFFPFEKKG
jgi:predicted transcriptional regulator YdeE